MIASDEIQRISARVEMLECKLLGVGSAESGAAAAMNFKMCFIGLE